jgi:hypothetical protein
MAFEIEQFRETLQAGARPNLFEVEIAGAEQISNFLVTAASLPGRTFGTASAFYRGRELKLAGDMVFAPWTTTIINDTSFQLREYIESWMNDYIEDLEVKTPNANEDGSPAGYFGDITVRQLDKAGNPTREYRLIGAWPSDISEVPLSFDANDQISSFTCTWQYQRFEVIGSGAV